MGVSLGQMVVSKNEAHSRNRQTRVKKNDHPRSQTKLARIKTIHASIETMERPTWRVATASHLRHLRIMYSPADDADANTGAESRYPCLLPTGVSPGGGSRREQG